MRKRLNQTGWKASIHFFKGSTVKLIGVLVFTTSISFAADASSGKRNGTADIDKKRPSEIPGMMLIWHDEFEEEGGPNANNWNYEYGFVRNQELQWYQPQNARCENGRLVIEARRETVANPEYNPLKQSWKTSREEAHYTSACVITKDLQEWPAFGYFEIRAKVDSSQGSWPAIWLLGTENYWPDCGEIDIMELYRINGEPNILANVAWGSSTAHRGEWDSSTTKLDHFLPKDPTWVEKFHTWAMKWNEHAIQLFLDGELLNEIPLHKTVNPDGVNPFTSDQNFYLLLNLAIGSNGGDPSNSKFPINFEVDYVRVYKQLN